MTQWYKVKATAQNGHLFTNPDSVTFEFLLDLENSAMMQMCERLARDLLKTQDPIEYTFTPIGVR